MPLLANSKTLRYARGGSPEFLAKQKELSIPLPNKYFVLFFSGRKIRPDVLIDWAIQIARGMAYLHDGAPISLGGIHTPTCS
jgi:hypothetical protein